MQKIKIRDLVPIWLEIPVDALDKPDVRQLFEHAQRCGLTTIRFPANHGYCRVCLTVITPQAQEEKNDLALFGREAEDSLQAMTNRVEMFVEHPLGEDTVRL